MSDTTKEHVLQVLGGNIVACSASGDCGAVLKSLSNDSRMVEQGGVFVAIKGSAGDGHRHIPEALSKGASMVIGTLSFNDARIPAGTSYVQVHDSYAAYSTLAALFCGYPARDLRIVGITGTNGKTTSAYLLNSILGGTQGTCGLISTVEYSCPSMRSPAKWTTPEPLEFQRLLREFRKSGCTFAAMEVSSHALSQHRLGDTLFDAAVFTNLTRDHLDYHMDMESYFSAKKRLFTEHLGRTSAAVVNIDDPYGRRLHSSIDGAMSFGKDTAADARIAKVAASDAGLEISISYKGREITLKSSLHGTFNAYNITGAFLAASVMGIDEFDILSGVANLTSVPGRMESFSSPGFPLVVVDYAHTDDALRNALRALRDEAPHKKIWIVFGCGGDRDSGKRPRMGAVASELADFIVVTDDNPRSENPHHISSQIISGIPQSSNVSVIHNRKDAISHAISTASQDHIVLVAGKGHEPYQDISGTKFPFDDRAVVRQILRII